MSIPGVLPAILGQQGGAAPFDPLSVGWHSAFWAEDPLWTPPADGAAVSSWNNAGTSGLDAAQATGAQQPLFRASVVDLNNKPAVEFDGVDDNLDTAGFTALSTGEVFMVARLLATGTTLAFFGAAAGITTIWLIGTSTTGDGEWRMFQGANLISVIDPDTVAHAFDAVFSGTTTSSLTLDGASIASGNAGSSLFDDLSLGRDRTGALSNCQIAFFGLFGDGVLTAQERSDLLAWAQTHYGTP